MALNGKGALPQGWEWVKLRDVCREDRSGVTREDPEYASMPYLGLEHLEAETGRIMITDDEARFSGTTSNNFRFTPSHVLYGKLRPYLNKVALPEFSGRCSTEIVPLNPTAADRRWLAWFLRRPETVEFAMLRKTGSRMPRAPMRDLLDLPVALPPIAEQLRIVDYLDTRLTAAKRARQVAEAQLRALEALPIALLRQIFERTPSGRLPKGWRSAMLGDICEIVGGSTPSTSVAQYWAGDICWITPMDLGALETIHITSSERYLTGEGYAACSTTMVPKGSIVMSSRAPIGHLGIARVPLCTNQGCKSFVPSGGIDSEYLYFSLRANVPKLQSMGAGATFPEVSKRKLSSFRIAVPPLAAQKRVVNSLRTVLASIEGATGAAKAESKAVNELSAAILRSVFGW